MYQSPLYIRKLNHLPPRSSPSFSNYSKIAMYRVIQNSCKQDLKLTLLGTQSLDQYTEHAYCSQFSHSQHPEILMFSVAVYILSSRMFMLCHMKFKLYFVVCNWKINYDSKIFLEKIWQFFGIWIFFLATKHSFGFHLQFMLHLIIY